RHCYSSQLLLVENLASGRRRFENKKLSILSTDVQFAVSQHWRRLLNRSESFNPELLAGVYVEGCDIRAVVDLVHPIAVKHWGRKATLPAISNPLSLVFLDLAFACRIDGDHHPHFTRIEILLTMSEDCRVVVNDYSRVQTAL